MSNQEEELAKTPPFVSVTTIFILNSEPHFSEKLRLARPSALHPLAFLQEKRCSPSLPPLKFLVFPLCRCRLHFRTKKIDEQDRR